MKGKAKNLSKDVLCGTLETPIPIDADAEAQLKLCRVSSLDVVGLPLCDLNISPNIP